MLQSYNATVDERGLIHLMGGVKIPSRARIIVTVLDDTAIDLESIQNSLLSEASLAKEWLSPEEEEAWKHLQ